MHKKKSPAKRGWFKALLVAAAVLLLLAVPKTSLYERSDGYFRETFLKTAATYAAIRGINAAVSVLKESQINVEPAGIGITLAAGQILDPLDDLTERISSLLVYSMLALGAQEVLLNAAGAYGFAAAALLLLFSLVGLSESEMLKRAGNAFFKGGVIAAALLFLMPSNLLLNNLFYENYLHPQIAQKQLRLAEYIAPAAETTEEPAVEVQKSGWINRVFEFMDMSHYTQRLKKSYEKYEKEFDELKKNLSDIISLLLELGYLYLGSAFFQLLLLPFVTVFILYRLYRTPLRFY
ncbi:hypothetical protein NNO_1735 [Hydrogenimonas sp.]|nr:hypothetical protein NNO_1735 [Hydrogenimonas sp.]